MDSFIILLIIGAPLTFILDVVVSGNKILGSAIATVIIYGAMFLIYILLESTVIG